MSSDSRGTTYRFVRRRWHVFFAIVDWYGWRAARAVRWVGLRIGYPTGNPTLFHEPRRILVIQLDHLGDAVISLPLLAALRERYPESSLEFLCSPWNVDLLRMATGVDRLHVFGCNRFARDWRRRLVFWLPALIHCAWRVRRGGFDVAIDVRGDSPHAVLMWLAGVGRRIGWNCAGGGFLLTDSPEYVPQRAEIESRRAILELLGAVPVVTPTVLLTPGDQARREINRRLSRVSDTDRPLVVLHIGAGTSAKRWPDKHWRELIGRLLYEDQVRVILVGSDDDRSRAAAILNTVYTFDANRAVLTDSEPLADDWTGSLSIAGLTAIAERAAVFVGGDSGPAHLAAAVGTPVVVLFSGTNHAEQWQPAGDHVTVVRRTVACAPCFRVDCHVPGHPCMQGLLPADVAQAVRAKLARTISEARQSHEIDSIPYPMEIDQT